MKGLARSGALLVLLGIATGCGGGGSSGDAGESTVEAAGATDAAAEVAATDAPVLTLVDSPVVTSPAATDAAPADGSQVPETAPPPPAGSLRVGVATDLQTLDPHLAQPAQLHFLDLVYDSLTAVSADGTVVPRLASSFTSDDLITWTVTLADGATFADGTPVDANAVVYSLERGKQTTESPSAPQFEQIASVTADDDTTVTIVLTGPNVSFARDMAGLPGMILDPASDGSDLSRAPAGAGPYEFDAGGSLEGAEYHYVAREGYWGTPVGVQEITLALVADPAARVNALQGGQLDIAAELGPSDQTKVAGSFDVVLAPTSEQVYLQVIDTEGTLVPALGDPLVREAMSYAIDREGINNAIFLGGGIPTTAWFPEGSPYYAPEVDGIGYDLDKARQLLSDAGFPDGFTFDSPTVDALRPLAEAVAGSLAQVGIIMNLQLQQPGTLGEQVRDGQWAASVTITRGQTPQIFYTERLAQDAPFNPFGADRAAVTAFGEQAMNATTIDEATQLWAQTYAQAVTEGIMIVVGQVTTGAALAPGVTGAQVPFGSLIPDLRTIRVDG